MKAVFLAPLITAFGETIQGVRLASALVDRGWEIDFLAPHELAPVVRRDRRIRYARVDRAMHRLDLEVAELARDVLVLVDAAGVDKVARREGWSRERIADASKTLIAIDCWNHSLDSLRWDYGPWTEVLEPIFFTRPNVICPVPFVSPSARGGYACVPSFAPRSEEARRATRRSWDIGDGEKLVVWPTARWQYPEAQQNRALAALAGLWPSLILPLLDRLGDGVKVVHVSPVPIAEADRPKSYLHSGNLPTERFEDLLAASDALLCFNASATSLVTALGFGIPTLLCTSAGYGDDPRFRALDLPPIIVGYDPPPIWMWPLSLDSIMGRTVRDNPFYATMARGDLFRGDELVAALRTLLFDDAERARIRAAQEAYVRIASALPSGAERVLACVESAS